MKYFDISWYSTKDGFGVRTVLFLQGCNLRCEWCHSPHSHPSKSPLLFYEDYCRKCQACTRDCPHMCHTFSGDHQLNREACIGCGLCVDLCANGALKMKSAELSSDAMFSKLKYELKLLNGIGGLTISGGEPMLQIGDVKKLLLLCREHGIHTAVETSACVENQAFREIEEYVDCWLFGLKQIDPVLCKEMCGADVYRILDNFCYLGDKNPKKIIVRTPLIYPVTSNISNIKAICSLMDEYRVKKIQLLKYNPYTALYYKALGLPFCQQSYRAVNQEELMKIMSVFEGSQIDCTYVE